MNKLRYAMTILWSDEDQCYLVELPEWEGRLLNYKTATHGDTYEEAAKNGREVLELLIETSREDGETLPEPLVYTSEEEEEWDEPAQIPQQDKQV